ncbi:MAG: LCP family protein [Eubacteriales bacterium]
MNNKPVKVPKKRYAAGIVLLLFFTVAVIIAAYFLAYKPSLDATMPFDAAPQGVTPQNGAEDDVRNAAQNADAEKSDAPVINDSGTPFEGVSYVRREGVYNFLVVGLDAEGGNHTDVIMLISYDINDGSIAVMSIPRDTYINVGRNFNKLNSFYTGEYNRLYGECQSEDERINQSMENLCDLIEVGFAVKIDYWAQMDLSGFRAIVDAIGGVDIDVPQDMDYEDPDQNLYIHLKAGEQTLTGAQAEQFVRFRSGYSTADKGRIEAQKIFVTAFLDTIKSRLTVDKVPAVVSNILACLKTSISAADCGYFAKSALGVSLSDITMITLPGEGAYNSSSGAWYEVIYRYSALDIINGYLNVYDHDITDELFDRYGYLNNYKASYISEVYYKSDAEANIETADEIDQNSISIPVKNS